MLGKALWTALTQMLKRAYTYHWRLWTIPEARAMLLAAGFDAAHVWLRPMRATHSPSAASSRHRRDEEHDGNGNHRRSRRDGRQRKAERHADMVDVDGSEDEPTADAKEEGIEAEADFKEWTGLTSFTAEERTRINTGWTAYIVGVVRPAAVHSST